MCLDLWLLYNKNFEPEEVKKTAVIEEVPGGRAIRLDGGRLISQSGGKLLVQWGSKALLIWKGDFPGRFFIHEVENPNFVWGSDIDISSTKETKTAIQIGDLGIITELLNAIINLTIDDFVKEISKIRESDVVWALNRVEDSLPAKG